MSNPFAFSVRCEAARQAADSDAAPFVPSRAQLEAQLRPIVDELLAMPSDKAAAYIRASFRGAGSVDAVALAMFKGAA